MDKFFEAYKTWPPQTQMQYAVVATICGSVLTFLFGWWGVDLVRDGFYHLAVIWRGWPDDKPTRGPASDRPSGPLRWLPWGAANKPTKEQTNDQ